VYKPGAALSIEHLCQLILLRLCDFLHGLNTEALVKCAMCGHYTVRRHPRGKEYCSSQCRWRAAVATRRETQEKHRTEEKRQTVSGRRGKK
jgi:hypothetical protein